MAQQSLDPLNNVELVGVLASECVQRELSDGRTVLQWRMKITPPEGASTTVPCATDISSVQKKLLGAQVGTAFAMSGSVTTRFWVSAGQTGSRVEILVTRADKCKLNT